MTTDLASALAAAMTALDPPAVIVTAASGDRRSGCLVTFSTQCSITPFRYLVLLARTNMTFDVAQAATALAVHVPGRSAGDLAELFGGRTGEDTDKFARASWRPWRDGTPLLDGCSWFVGPVVARAEAGDHVGMVIEPVAAGGSPTPALRLEDVQHITPGHPL